MTPPISTESNHDQSTARVGKTPVRTTDPARNIDEGEILALRPNRRAASRSVSTGDDQGSDDSPGISPVAKRAARGGARHLTIADVCAELGITRSTFYDWRAKRKAPPCFKLPNGEIRIRRIAFDTWLSGLEEEAA